jgi:hypothetical protein
MGCDGCMHACMDPYKAAILVIECDTVEMNIKRGQLIIIAAM